MNRIDLKETGRIFALLAILVFAACLILFSKRTPVHPVRSQGHRVSFDYSQIDHLGIRLELPREWRLKYNGKFRWRQGSAVDANERPRIEIVFFGRSSPAILTQVQGEEVAFPVGKFKVVKSEERMSRPFSSFPDVARNPIQAIIYHFIGELEFYFRIRKIDESELKPVIWRIMETVERDNS